MIDWSSWFVLIARDSDLMTWLPPFHSSAAYDHHVGQSRCDSDQRDNAFQPTCLLMGLLCLAQSESNFKLRGHVAGDLCGGGLKEETSDAWKLSCILEDSHPRMLAGRSWEQAPFQFHPLAAAGQMPPAVLQPILAIANVIAVRIQMQFYWFIMSEAWKIIEIRLTMTYCPAGTALFP